MIDNDCLLEGGPGFASTSPHLRSLENLNLLTVLKVM
jgi:hypothetical protein